MSLLGGAFNDFAEDDGRQLDPGPVPRAAQPRRKAHEWRERRGEALRAELRRDPRRHRKTLRMGKHVFDLLLAEVALILWAPTSSNGKSIPVIDKLCIFLNWAGAATGLNDLSNIWGVSQTSCTEAINFVIGCMTLGLTNTLDSLVSQDARTLLRGFQGCLVFLLR